VGRLPFGAVDCGPEICGPGPVGPPGRPPGVAMGGINGFKAGAWWKNFDKQNFTRSPTSANPPAAEAMPTPALAPVDKPAFPAPWVLF
jgi:hypothetical protein